MSDLLLEIVTPTQKVFSGTVKSVVAPGSQGYFGILQRHAPLLSTLAIGEIRARVDDRDKKIFATSEGFLEVSSNKITIIAEAVEEANAIDVDRAEAARHRAEKRIAEGREKWDIARAQAALSRAINRLHVVGKN
ncbi:MAG: F0F1 ATP synthase subunit epsilon [Deferribacteres bacterium]|nr:F0F1 ATP synthase subunit epsilon [candidate division KSB1 bacterium]MCB9511741.1 F0F1 ATP synthase subunit epsilon [Deferribacteres bacterium]